MQVDMHHIEAHIAWATGSQHRIQVGTIVVHQRTSLMHHLCNLRDGMLENTQRIGIGHHHSSDTWTFLFDESLKVFYINLAI